MNAPAILYDALMAPLERRALRKIRRELVGTARGSVLELGAGTGVNIPYYQHPDVTQLILSDWVDRRDILIRRATLEQLPFRIEARVIDAQRLPFDDAQFDTIVGTLLFCSVPCVPCSFSEIRRVLKDDGQFLFLEHVRPSRPVAAALADVVTPAWKRVSGGCHLNRETVRELRRAGFSLQMMGSKAGVFRWGRASTTLY